jgi:aspartate beta-hydroxylase
MSTNLTAHPSDKRDLIAMVLEPLRKQYGRTELVRVDRCLSMYMGDTEIVYPDARQKPVFMFFPGIRVQPYYASSEFDWVGMIESRTDAIRREFLSIMRRDGEVELFYKNDRSPFKKLMPDWNAFFFFRYGRRYDFNHELCPVTSDTLSMLPLCHVHNHSPETLFSILAPRGQLFPHSGVTNTRLVAHLPLIIPRGCSLTVGGETHEWQEGRIVVFDDTFVHSARNDSDVWRGILLLDIWHPDLTEAERIAMMKVISALASDETNS